MRSLRIIALFFFSAFMFLTLSCHLVPDESLIKGKVTSIAEGDGGEGTVIWIDKGSAAGIELNQEGWVIEKGDAIAMIRVDDIKPDSCRAVVLEHTPFKAVTEGLSVRFDRNGTILSPETPASEKPCGPNSPGPYVPTLGGNFARTGSYDEKGVPTPVGVLWKFVAYGAITTFTPPVANGLVFFGNGMFSAVNIETGKEKNRFPELSIVDESPTVLKGTIYIPDYSYLYALDVKTGIVKWRFDARASAPAVAEGIVFFAGLDEGTLFALDAETGKEIWRFRTIERALLSPAVGDVTVYTCSPADYLWALDAKTGAVKWKSSFGNSLMVSKYPVVGDSLVYVCNDDFLRAVDKKSGDEKWKFSINSYGYTTPAVACNVIYIFDTGCLIALDARTGLLKWKSSLKELGIKEETKLYEPPVVVRGVVYFGGLDESVYAVNANTGKLIWSYKTEYKTSTPVIVDGVLYVTSGPYLYAIK